MVPLKRVRKAMLVKKEKLRGETCESMESKCKSMGKLFRYENSFVFLSFIL